MIPSSIRCTCNQGSEGVPYSLDLSIQMLDEHWWGFASHAANIDCYNISSGVRGKTCRWSFLTSFSDIFWMEDIILQVPTLATSAKFVGGGRVKVPINVGSFSRPTPILWSLLGLPWIIGMLPVTYELLGRKVCWSMIVIPLWEVNAIFLK